MKENEFMEVIVELLNIQSELEYKRRVGKHIPPIYILGSSILLLHNPIFILISLVLILILCYTISRITLSDVKKKQESKLLNISTWLDELDEDEKMKISNTEIILKLLKE